MNIRNSLLLALLLAGLLVVLAGCGNRGGTGMPDLIEPYEAAMRDFPGAVTAVDIGLARFKATYKDLTDPRLPDMIRETYAEVLFFNDTLHTFHNIDDLIDYMTRTGAALSESVVEVQQVLQDGPDVYVRWTMEFKTRAVGRDIHSRSIGMSHLRFDDDGRVVLHQDFWDSGHGLYMHLPFVGFAVRRARRAL